jgi:hypothetical protein
MQPEAEVLARIPWKGPGSGVAINRILREKMNAESQS